MLHDKTLYWCAVLAGTALLVSTWRLLPEDGRFFIGIPAGLLLVAAVVWGQVRFTER